MHLRMLGENYYAALKHFGDVAEHEAIMQLLAPTCQKWMNGVCVGASRDDIQNQLIQAREHSGLWEIELHKAIPSAEDRSCVIKYTISAPKAGAFLVMAMLAFNTDGLVIEVDEVFHQLA